MSEYDYIIVGAGIVGLSTAYHLRLEKPNARILVVDKTHGPGGGDTSKSAAAFRVFFTNRVNFLLAKASVSFYKSIQESGWDLSMRWVGYLFMVDKRRLEELRPGLAWADKHGLPYEVIEPGILEEALGVRTRVEGLEEAEIMGAQDIVEGILIRKAGTLMPDKLVSYYYEWLRSHNVDFAFNTRVTGFSLKPREPLGLEGEPFPWQDARVDGIIVGGDREIRAREKTIVAAGAWTPYLLEPIGVDSYSRPKKRQIFVVKADTPERRRTLYPARDLNGEGVSPMLILPNGAYLRPAPEEGSFWTGFSDELGRPFMLEEDPVPEERFYIYGVHPMISLYLPAFEGANPSNMWAGHYDLSFDGMPVIYEAFESDLIVSAGTSGSGILKGDAIGSVTAAVALGEDTVRLYTGDELPVKWLGLRDRLLEKELLII